MVVAASLPIKGRAGATWATYVSPPVLRAGPCLTVKLSLQPRHMQLFSPLSFHLLAKLPFPALERNHLSLRRFHEALALRFDRLFDHVTHPSITPSQSIKLGNRGRFRAMVSRYGMSKGTGLSRRKVGKVVRGMRTEQPLIKEAAN